MEGLNWELKIARTEQLWPNPWNPNKQSTFIYEKEKNSIQKFGFIEPIQVRDLPGVQAPWIGRPYQIINGEHRWKAVEDLKIQEMPIIDLGIVSDKIAKQLTLILNETHGEPNPIELSRLIQDLNAEVDWSELETNLPFEPETLEGLLKMIEIPEYEEKSTPAKGDTVTLHFELPKRDARFVAQVLDRINDDRSNALVHLCKESNKTLRRSRPGD